MNPLKLNDKETRYIEYLGLDKFPDLYSFMIHKNLFKGEPLKDYKTNEAEKESISDMITNISPLRSKYSDVEEICDLPEGYLSFYIDHDYRMNRIYAIRIVRKTPVILRG